MILKQIPQVELRSGQAKTSEGVVNYWHIYTDSERAGKVFIKLIDEAPFGKHHSIQIFINKANQGQGIGSIAYKMACEASDLVEIYAHMRKSNIASKRAAEKAGFRVINLPNIRQLSLVWRK